MNPEAKKLQKDMTKHYKFINNFVNDYCKSEKDKQEFFEHFNEIIDINLELERMCGE